MYNILMSDFIISINFLNKTHIHKGTKKQTNQPKYKTKRLSSLIRSYLQRELTSEDFMKVYRLREY